MVPFLGAGSQLEGGGITLGYSTRAICSLCALLCVLPVPCQLASIHFILSLLSQPLLHLTCPLLWSCLHIVKAQVWVSPQAFPSVSFFPLCAAPVLSCCHRLWSWLGGMPFSALPTPFAVFLLFFFFFCGLTAWLSLLLMSNISTGPSTCQRFPGASG